MLKTDRSQSPTTKIALIQMEMVADPHANFDHACELVRQAASQGGEIICLPELFRTRYFCQTEDHANFALAETIPGPSTEALGNLARELSVAIVASLFERRAAGLYHNTAAVLDRDGRYLGKYRKMHIPDDPLFYEKFYFAPGDLGFNVFDTSYARAGVLICWDQWYPEAARLTALQGAEVLLYPTAIGWHPAEKGLVGKVQHDSWELIQRSHAVANGCYVVAVNRIGFEPSPDCIQQDEPPADPNAKIKHAGIEFWGQSFVADPSGQVIARGSIGREEIIVVEIDRRKIETARTHWPFLRDRRIDAYNSLTRRWIDKETQ